MVKKPVLQFNEDGTLADIHKSIIDAANKMECDEATIRYAIKNNKKSFGFNWQHPIDEQQINKIKGARYHKTLSKSAIKVPDRYIENPEIIENLIKYGTEYDPKDVAFNKGYGILKDKIEYSAKPEDSFNKPKILLIDIETAPVRAYVWSLWKQNVGLSQIISDYFILTWSAKWLGEATIISERLTGEEAIKENDKRIVKKLWTLLDEAEVIIGHKGNSFDIPKINTRFVVHGMIPPSPYKTIDTLLIARNQFGFTSNRLQHLATSFGIEGKYDTTFELWAKCLQGDEESLEYMELYNQHDVEVLEEVYLKLRPYAKGHANLDLYYDDKLPHCPACGGHNLNLEINKKFYTQAVQYDTYRCRDCGSISRAKKGNKYINKKVISSIPR